MKSHVIFTQFRQIIQLKSWQCDEMTILAEIILHYKIAENNQIKSNKIYDILQNIFDI